MCVCVCVCVCGCVCVCVSVCARMCAKHVTIYVCRVHQHDSLAVCSAHTNPRIKGKKRRECDYINFIVLILVGHPGLLF